MNENSIFNEEPWCKTLFSMMSLLCVTGGIYVFVHLWDKWRRHIFPEISLISLLQPTTQERSLRFPQRRNGSYFWSITDRGLDFPGKMLSQNSLSCLPLTNSATPLQYESDSDIHIHRSQCYFLEYSPRWQNLPFK